MPPDGQPYLAVKKPAKGPGRGPSTLDFELRKGVWLQGQVADAKEDPRWPLTFAAAVNARVSNGDGIAVARGTAWPCEPPLTRGTMLSDAR